MAHSRLWLATAALAAGGILPGAFGLFVAQPTVVGVVDVDRALEMHPKMPAERERLDALNKGYKERLDALTKQLKQLDSDIGLMEPGSDQAEMAVHELKSGKGRLDLMRALARREWEAERDKGLVALYQDAERAITAVAKAKGIQIVVRKHAIPTGEDLSKDEDRAQRQRLVAYDARSVWFAAEEVDLTGAVIKFLAVPGETKDAGATKGDDGKAQSGAVAPAKDGAR